MGDLQIKFTLKYGICGFYEQKEKSNLCVFKGVDLLGRSQRIQKHMCSSGLLQILINIFRNEK